MELDAEKQAAYELVLAGKNLLITGVAGTGKSYFLKYLRDHLSGINITATTGIAAVNIGGSTIHSYAGIGLGRDDVEIIYQNLRPKPRRRILEVKILVIDEISMMSADLFNKLDALFKKVRCNERPFGGAQLIVFGDFLQLPPVEKGKAPSFCFESKAWAEASFERVELKKVYRQDDQTFVDILNDIRVGRLSEEGEEILKNCVYAKEKVPEGIVPVVLTSLNARADQINAMKLGQIDEEEVKFFMKTDGPDYHVEKLMANCNARPEITLKIGAQVMMLTNLLQSRGIVNGSMGKIVRFSSDRLPVVKFLNGAEIEVEPHVWKMTETDPGSGEQETLAAVSQVPLALAWGISIHKSQGMTLEFLYVELGSVFCDAQVYVALSRAKNLAGLFIKDFDRSKIKVNPKAVEFYTGTDS